MYAPEEFMRRQRSVFEVNLGTAERPKVFEVGVQWASTINMLDIRRFLEDGSVPLPREALQSLEVCRTQREGRLSEIPRWCRCA